MSKEKNLTMVRTINGHHGACVDPSEHIYCVEQISEHDDYFPGRRRILCPPVEGLFGPAIDRLHEFEKLGLEPEEIEEKLKEYKVAINRVYGLANEKEALTKGYTVTVEEYCTRINEKNEEIAELERRLKNARHLNSVCTNSITDMRREIDGLKKENDELKNRVAYRSLHMNNISLKQMVAEKDEQIKYYQDKLERIDCILTEEECDES